jgi:hypothetical protein
VHLLEESLGFRVLARGSAYRWLASLSWARTRPPDTAITIDCTASSSRLVTPCSLATPEYSAIQG